MGQTWPFESTKRSRSAQFGFWGSMCISEKYSAATMSEAEREPPGWPDCASYIMVTAVLRSCLARSLSIAIFSSFIISTPISARRPSHRVVVAEDHGLALARGLERRGRELEDLQALVKAGEDGLVVLEAVLEVLVDVEDDLVLVEVVGVVEGDGLLMVHVDGLVGELVELEHVAAAEQDAALGADVALQVGARAGAPAGHDGGHGAVLAAHYHGGVGVVLRDGVDGALDVAGDGVELAGEGGQQVELVGDGLDGHAAGELRVGAPGVAVHGVVLAVAEAGADTVAEHIHGLTEHAARHQLVHLHKGGAVPVGEADDDLRVVLFGHVDYLQRVLHGGGDGLFKVERHVPGEDHLAVVEPLGGRGGDHGVFGALHILGDLLVAELVAVELLGKAPEPLGVHVVGADY